MFRLVKKGNVSYYIIDSFEETGLVKHCFTTRQGGVSSGPYDSMNLRFNCDDIKENVIENYKIICDAIGVDYKKLVLSKQVHEDIIYKADYEDCGNGIIFENRFSSVDGLITDKPGIPLCTVYADCVPLFFLDKKQGVIASVHSGWRGTVQRIGQKAVKMLIDEYNSHPEDILAAIGPSIGECHFEVSDEIAGIFDKEFGEDTVVKYDNKYHVNLEKACYSQFIAEGIPEKNITAAGICTYCNSDLLFSHRKTNGIRGNLGAIIELKGGNSR